MVRFCCVTSCNVSGDGVDYFKFPVSKTLRAAWLAVCGAAGDAVCSAHFTDDDYKRARGARRLLATAVPSVGLPENSSITEEETKDPPETTTRPKRPTKSKKKGGKKKIKKRIIENQKEIVNVEVDKEKIKTTDKDAVEKEKVKTDKDAVEKEIVKTDKDAVEKEIVKTNKDAVEKEIVKTTDKEAVEKEKLKDKEADKSQGAICVKENGKINTTGESIVIEENDVEEMITNYQIQTKSLDPEPLEDLIPSILADHFKQVSKKMDTVVSSKPHGGSVDASDQLDSATMTRIANRLASELDVQLNYPMPGLMGMNPMSDVIELDRAPVFIEVPVEERGASRAASPQDCLMVLESVQCDVDPGSLMLPDSGSDMEILDVPDDDGKPTIRKKKAEAISLLTSSDEDEVIFQEPKIDTVEVSDDTDEDDRPLQALIKKPKMIPKPKRKSVFGMYQYYCEQCTYKTDDESHFKKHNLDLDHSTPLQICQFCSYTTASRVQFARHKRKHRDERNYKCHFCNYKARHNMSLMYHLKSHDRPSGRMPKFTCEKCGFYSDVKAEGLNHIKTCRDGRFLCDFCDYSTKRKSDLKRHMGRRHRDEDIDDEDFTL